jgi:macrodomain Ter protein organizer (MatP/YcbG family)
MVIKSVSIKLDDEVWEQFKKVAKAQGRTLEFAVQQLFYDALERVPITAGTTQAPTEDVSSLDKEN